jgi:cobalt/nickel transport system permease protein
MHISEGVLSGPVLVSGAASAVACVAIGLKRLDYDNMPRTAILAATFFVASLVHVPVGPANVHLILNGLLGILLGWSVFPAIMIALVLQAVFFQFGGITTLGINTVIMALPAISVYYIVRFLWRKKPSLMLPTAFFGGFFSVFLSSILLYAALMFTHDAFSEVAATVVITHLPLMVIEGIITAFSIAFLKKVQPSLLKV